MTKSLFLILFLLLAVIVAGAFAWYRQSPAARWAGQVRRRVQELSSRLNALQNPARGDSAAEKLAAELFLKQRQNVPAGELANYPNIGPGTVEQLRKAGITNLVDAEEHVTAILFKKKIENLGDFRETALKNAVNELIAAERKRFDAGTSAEGAEYQRRLATLSREEQDRAAAKAREAAAVEVCRDHTREFERIAASVSFVGWLTWQPSAVTPEWLAKPLPAVEIAPAPPPRAESSPPAPTPSQPPSDGTADAKLGPLQAYCQFAILIAKADGRIAAAERGVIRNFLVGRFGSDPILLRHLDPQLERAEANRNDEADAIAEIKRLVPADEWPALYAFATQVADAAGNRNAKETEYLADLAAALGIVAEPEPPAAPTPVNTPTPAEAPAAPLPIDHRAALEIDASTEITAELVRRKYAMLLERTAKAKALGGDYARMAAIQEAHGKAAAEALLAPLGEPLEKVIPDAPKDIRHNPDLDDLFK